MFAIDWKETTQGITVFDWKGIEYLTQTQNCYFKPRILDLTEFIVLRSTTSGYKNKDTGKSNFVAKTQFFKFNLL